MNDLWARLSREGVLTADLRAAVAAELGDRGRKAIRAIDDGRVTRFRDFFVVKGSAGEYVVDGDFCTCGDFLFRGRECSHIIAVRIAAITGSFLRDEHWYQDLMRGGADGA
jgi:predicted nucleic acid-binding Zn finger protein